MKVFVIHNSPKTCDTLSKTLSSAGYDDVEAAHSMGAALTILSDEGRGEGPAVILLGLELSDMDGVAACRILSTTPGLSNLPVIILAGASDAADRLDEAFESGAFDFVSEPYQARDLAARIRAALRLKAEMDARRERERELEEAVRTHRALSGRATSANEQIRLLGAIDPLTKLSNRGKFEDTIHFQVRDAIRKGAPLSLLLLDIDHFKRFNDRYGHRPGDKCLQVVAHKIRESLNRTTDTAARYGGEEFAIILPDTDVEGARVVAETIRTNIEALGIKHEASDTAPVVTVSIGVASALPTRTATPDLYVLGADKALYRAKETGRNRHEIATKEEMEEAARAAEASNPR